MTSKDQATVAVVLKNFNIICSVQRQVLSGKKSKKLTKPIIKIEDLVVQRSYEQSK